jgi:hypothetical protein
VPADLERLHQYHGPTLDLVSWAKQYLLASPGALVLQDGRVRRIPTLVPARQSSGACIFLTPENQCAVHAAAPFGCAFFDVHQSDQEANRRSLCGLRAIQHAWREAGIYALVWFALEEAGRVAPAPEVRRQRMQEALDRNPSLNEQREERGLHDRTEPLRRARRAEINAQPADREALTARYGQVWDTAELSRDFEVLGFLAPLVVVRRKVDGQLGSLEFQDHPRLFFAFEKHRP